MKILCAFLILLPVLYSCNTDHSEKANNSTIDNSTLHNNLSTSIENRVEIIDTCKFSINYFLDTSGFSNDYLIDFWNKMTLDLGKPFFWIKELDSIETTNNKYFIISLTGFQIRKKSRSAAYRLILVTGQKNILYDSKFFNPECDAFGFYNGGLAVDSIINSEYIVLTEKKYKHPCCGASEEIILRNIYFNDQKGSIDFKFEKYYKYFDNDDCGSEHNIEIERKTELIKIATDFLQLQTSYKTNNKFDSTRSKNILFSID